MDQILKTSALALAFCGLVFTAIADDAAPCGDRVAHIAVEDEASPAERRVEASLRRRLAAAETTVAEAGDDDARVRMRGRSASVAEAAPGLHAHVRTRGRSAGPAESAPGVQVASLGGQIVVVAASTGAPVVVSDEMSREARRAHAAERRVARAGGC